MPELDQNFDLRRLACASTSIPEPRSTILPGSGVAPPGPNMSNDSEGIVPTSLDEASDGQPGDMQPTPLLWSQYIVLPFSVVAFCRFSQYMPEPRIMLASTTFAVSLKMS